MEPAHDNAPGHHSAGLSGVPVDAGVVASINGSTVVVGTAELFADLGLSVAAFGDWPRRLQQQGQEVLFVAVDGGAAGFIGVIDQETG